MRKPLGTHQDLGAGSAAVASAAVAAVAAVELPELRRVVDGLLDRLAAPRGGGTSAEGLLVGLGKAVDQVPVAQAKEEEHQEEEHQEAEHQEAAVEAVVCPPCLQDRDRPSRT